jgi:hypothetical protein
LCLPDSNFLQKEQESNDDEQNTVSINDENKNKHDQEKKGLADVKQNNVTFSTPKKNSIHFVRSPSIFHHHPIRFILFVL